MSVGFKIKVARTSKQMSRKELADLLGVTVACIARYENDNREPNRLMMIKISEALDSHVMELFFAS